MLPVLRGVSLILATLMVLSTLAPVTSVGADLQDCYPLSEGQSNSAQGTSSQVKVHMEIVEEGSSEPMDTLSHAEYNTARNKGSGGGSDLLDLDSIRRLAHRQVKHTNTAESSASFSLDSLTAFKIVEGDAEKAVECCKLSPFDSVCTKPGADEGSVDVATSVEKLPSDALALAEAVPIPSVTLTQAQPTQIVNATIASTNYLGAYTLVTWPLAQLVHAAFYVTRMLKGVRTRCEFMQLVGNVGNSVPFSDNDCTKLCTDKGKCSVFEYCGKRIPRTDGQASLWFSIRIKDRYYDMGYVTTSGDAAPTYAFNVKISNDCLNPYPKNGSSSSHPGRPGGKFVDTQYSTSGTVSVYVDPADGTVDLLLQNVFFGYMNHAWRIAKAILHVQ